MDYKNKNIDKTNLRKIGRILMYSNYSAASSGISIPVSLLNRSARKGSSRATQSSVDPTHLISARDKELVIDGKSYRSIIPMGLRLLMPAPAITHNYAGASSAT